MLFHFLFLAVYMFGFSLCTFFMFIFPSSSFLLYQTSHEIEYEMVQLGRCKVVILSIESVCLSILNTNHIYKSVWRRVCARMLWAGLCWLYKTVTSSIFFFFLSFATVSGSSFSLSLFATLRCFILHVAPKEALCIDAPYATYNFNGHGRVTSGFSHYLTWIDMHLYSLELIGMRFVQLSSSLQFYFLE